MRMVPTCQGHRSLLLYCFQEPLQHYMGYLHFIWHVPSLHPTNPISIPKEIAIPYYFSRYCEAHLFVEIVGYLLGFYTRRIGQRQGSHVAVCASFLESLSLG
jgi:hypothetical protein